MSNAQSLNTTQDLLQVEMDLAALGITDKDPEIVVVNKQQTKEEQRYTAFVEVKGCLSMHSTHSHCLVIVYGIIAPIITPS